MTTYTGEDTTDHDCKRRTGEPDALKGASPVRGGAVGKGLPRREQYLAGRLLYVNARRCSPMWASRQKGSTEPK